MYDEGSRRIRGGELKVDQRKPMEKPNNEEEGEEGKGRTETSHRRCTFFSGDATRACTSPFSFSQYRRLAVDRFRHMCHESSLATISFRGGAWL